MHIYIYIYIYIYKFQPLRVFLVVFTVYSNSFFRSREFTILMPVTLREDGPFTSRDRFYVHVPLVSINGSSGLRTMPQGFGSGNRGFVAFDSTFSTFCASSKASSTLWTCLLPGRLAMVDSLTVAIKNRQFCEMLAGFYQ